VGVAFNAGVAANPFPGLIDEVAIYNSILSPARVAAHYAARMNASSGTGGGMSAGAVGRTIMQLKQSAKTKKTPPGQQKPPAPPTVKKRRGSDIERLKDGD
jgi:hypothetical protein